MSPTTELLGQSQNTTTLAEEPSASATVGRAEDVQFDIFRNPALLQELPGIMTAFDESAMREYLQAAFFGTDSPHYTIEQCTPIKPIYLPGECCIVQYEFRARDVMSGETLEPIVIGRVFANQLACALYMHDKLEPLAALMDGRPEIAPFAAPVTTIEPLNMAVHVFPIDGELPTLISASDPQHMCEVFRATVPEALYRNFVIDTCEVELVSYRRRKRCVLRYTLDGRGGDSQPWRLVVYGKLTADANGALLDPAVAALREHVLGGNSAYRFNIPRALGWRPELQISLLEAIPGKSLIGRALKARLRGEPELPEAPPLEEMIAIGGRVAAALHGSGIAMGLTRTLADELAALHDEIAITRQAAPEIADQAQAWYEQIAAAGVRTAPLKLCFAHGDFKYAQVLFDGTASGLIDYDTICQAEPALDLGQFLAYLRTQVQKARKSSGPTSLAEELSAQFLSAYVAAAGDRLEDEQQLRARTTIYEAVSLLRMALHSQQKFKNDRLENTTTILEERIACLP